MPRQLFPFNNQTCYRPAIVYPMPLRLSPPPSGELTESQPLNHDRQYANDVFDDVFGSDPDSPPFGNDERSDVPRLKEKHETEGYRDGVTKGKTESVQAGFDEGYGLGAVLGLRIGKILGLLEGIYSAICAAEGDQWKVENERVGTLYEDAKSELSTQSVFGKEWWGEDGIWKYEVSAEGGEKEVVFPDVAAAHPLVKKWEGKVDEEVQTWGLDLGIMDHEHTEEEDAKVDRASDPAARQRPAEGKEAAVEPVSASAGLFMGISKKDLNW